MNAKKYFKTEPEASAFYATCKGEASLGTVRKDLRAELGNFIVQYTEDAANSFTCGKKLVVTMANGDKATRATKNPYKAVVVGYDRFGKLSVLSAHYTVEGAIKSIAAHKAGEFVNFKYRNNLAGEPILIA